MQFLVAIALCLAAVNAEGGANSPGDAPTVGNNSDPTSTTPANAFDDAAKFAAKALPSGSATDRLRLLANLYPEAGQAISDYLSAHPTPSSFPNAFNDIISARETQAAGNRNAKLITHVPSSARAQFSTWVAQQTGVVSLDDFKNFLTGGKPDDGSNVGSDPPRTLNLQPTHTRTMNLQPTRNPSGSGDNSAGKKPAGNVTVVGNAAHVNAMIQFYLHGVDVQGKKVVSPGQLALAVNVANGNPVLSLDYNVSAGNNNRSVFNYGFHLGFHRLVEYNATIPPTRRHDAHASNDIRFRDMISQFWNDISSSVNIQIVDGSAVRTTTSTLAFDNDPLYGDFNFTLQTMVTDSVTQTPNGISLTPTAMKYSVFISNFPFQFTNSSLALVHNAWERSQNVTFNSTSGNFTFGQSFGLMNYEKTILCDGAHVPVGFYNNSLFTQLQASIAAVGDANPSGFPDPIAFAFTFPACDQYEWDPEVGIQASHVNTNAGLPPGSEMSSEADMSSSSNSSDAASPASTASALTLSSIWTVAVACLAVLLA